jgi:hypothetical protein
MTAPALPSLVAAMSGLAGCPSLARSGGEPGVGESGEEEKGEEEGDGEGVEGKIWVGM